MINTHQLFFLITLSYSRTYVMDKNKEKEDFKPDASLKAKFTTDDQIGHEKFDSKHEANFYNKYASNIENERTNDGRENETYKTTNENKDKDELTENVEDLEKGNAKAHLDEMMQKEKTKANEFKEPKLEEFEKPKKAENQEAKNSVDIEVNKNEEFIKRSANEFNQAKENSDDSLYKEWMYSKKDLYKDQHKDGTNWKSYLEDKNNFKKNKNKKAYKEYSSSYDEEMEDTSSNFSSEYEPKYNYRTRFDRFRKEHDDFTIPKLSKKEKEKRRIKKNLGKSDWNGDSGYPDRSYL